MNRLTLLVSLILLGCSSAFAACTGSSPTWTTTPDQASVQTCINNASNGDTVNVSAGSASWTSVTLSKDITLNGAGQGVTSGLPITAAGGVTTSCASSGTCIDVSGGNPAFTITLSTSGNTRINNFAFLVENNGNLPHTIEINGNWPTSYGLIWENDTFTVNNGTVIDNYLPGGVIFSGITFNGNWNDFFMTIKDDSSYVSWTTYADTIGNRDTTGLYNNYIENSTFNGGSNGVLDCDDNCRMVLRNNTFNESGGFNSHGDDSSPVGMRHFEIYNNSFNFPDMTCAGGTTSLSNINQYIWLRGGTGVIYSNTFVGLDSTCWGDKPEIRGSIRGIQDDLAFLPPAYTTRIASCGAVTYPAPNQLGQNFNGTSLFTDPIYTWGNSGNLDGGGFHVEFATGFVDFGGGANPCSFTWSTFFQWGRDAVNTTVGSNTCDTTGCSVDVGLGGDTAKSGYTAYTYPHPLTVPAVSSVITLNDAVNVGCTTSSGLCAGAGLNMGQASGAFPQFKNLLEFANPGFEWPLVQQIFQFAVNPCTFCSVTTFQWNASNTNFTDYTLNQWAKATFTVSGNCYSGMAGCTGGGTADPASGCVGTIASNTAATGGFGSQFTINLATNQGAAGCAGPLGIPGQVITISTNSNMTNIAPPSTTGWPQATLSGTVTAENSDLCAGCGTQAVDFNGASSLTLSNTAYTTLGVEKTITLNGNYTISFMAKSVSGSLTALTFTLTTRNGACANPSPCTYTPTLTTSWAQYSHTFALTETPSPSDPFSIGVTFSVTSGADVRFDNVAFTDPSTNPTAFSDTFVNTLKAYCQSAANTTGPKCALRYGPSPDSETMSNWVKSVFLAQPSTEAANSTNIQFSFGPGYFTLKPRIYDFLQLCAYVGATPVLIVPVTLSAADAASLMDYLEDNAGSTIYGAIRQAQGQTAAWVGNGSSPFPFIFLEMGNENWNGLFLGHALFGHTNNPNNYFDYGIHIGNQIIAPARARQVAQSYSQSVTKFMANSQTGSTTDLKYLTAFICGQPGYSGGTITCTQGSEDGIEYQQYYATSINGVSTTNCTTGTPNNANCGLYGPTLTETWSDYYDPSSTSGAAQTLTAIKGISSCGPAHTTACLPATYERATYPTGNANFTQAVSDTFTQAGFHGVADGIAYAEANHNGLAYIAEYASESYALSQGGVNVHIYGAFLDNGGDTSVTNAALFGGNYTPRPQMGAAEVTNYCQIGQEVTTTGTSIPTYNLGANSNGVHAISNVPNLTFHEYASGAQRCLLINNNDIHNSYTVGLAGTNVPSTVTQYQQAPSSPSVSNETTNLNPVSTIAAAVYPVLTTNVTPGTLPPTSTTAWLWSTSSTSITANFNSRSGGTTLPPNFFGLNCGGISSNSRYDLVGAAGLEHCRIFPDINQDCPAGTCGSWSIPIAEVTDILKNNPGAKVMLDFVNTPSNLGTFTCSPPSNPTTWAGYVNTGIAAIKAGVPAGVIDSVEIWNEPDNGTVGGSSGSWCPATGTLLGAYKTFIATAGPIIKSANPTLQVGMPALASTANAVAWFGAGGILGSWSTPDFISYHYYGASTFASWASLLASMQSASTGVGAEFTTIQSILAGQSYVGKIRNTEFNDSYAYSPDCCRFDSTYSLIYNPLNAIDLLNVVNTSGATSLPSLSFYFASEGSSANGFCLWWTLGTANCANGTPPLSASPPYYAYTLMNMLNLPLGGNMATSISPASTLAGLSCSAFYTSQGDSVLCVNPTASAITSVTVTLNNAGIANAIGQQFLLNAANPGVTNSALALTPISGGYTATVNIPAYSALGMSIGISPPTKLSAVKVAGAIIQ